MFVDQILKSKGTEGVVTLPPKSSVEEAAHVLSDKRIGTVVISSNGKTVDGILSERDIVRELGRRGSSCLQDNVAEMMTSKIITCAREDSADSVLKKMTEGRFRHMPVVEDGAMVGLISLGDVVKARLTELAMENDALQSMVMGH
ncbi:CBS domain-containing protein [Alphaproteobacteria bacterium KMM 3653]|uniref:CBS domain-containing protein n=1 Tax=Harenicola maris TaxID=2841044 RepID=A0AAP2CL50_9RHOB|nr:CBS domain-containing protein [Harenicola maris]